MKVSILQSIAGNAEPMYGQPEFGYAPGQVVEVDDALARAWIAGGIAAKAKKSGGAAVSVPEPQLNIEPEA